MNKQKLNEMQEQRKKLQSEIDQIIVRKARKKVYHEALQKIREQDNYPDKESNLALWISNVKEEAEVADSFEKEPSVCESLAHFEKEILLMMRFNHPNIVKIYKVVESQEELFIIMACAYGDLASYVTKMGYLKEDEARRIFRQIVSAVDFIHSANVVHRDLKLENILLDQRGNVLVSDFGLGRSFTNSDYMKTFCGTPAYSAPEIIGGFAYNGTKIDIWAMGVILYTMTAGNLPFIGDNVNAVFTKIRNCQYDYPDNFSWELKMLIGQILVPDPDSRIGIEGIRNSRWVNIGYGQSPEQYPSPQIDKDSLAKLISSVTFECNCTIYNINFHKNLELDKSIKLYEKVQVQKHPSNLANYQRRKSASYQPSISSYTGRYSVPKSMYRSQNTASTAESEFCPKFSSKEYIPEKAQMNTSLKVFRRNSAIECSPNSIRCDSASRELSVIHRMSNLSQGSFPSELQLNFNEIKEWHGIHKPPKRIRTMKFQFKRGMFSSRDPPSMFQDLHRVLVEMKSLYDINITKLDEYYLFHVEMDKVVIDIELCKVWLLNLHGLKISMSGNASEFIDTLVSKLDNGDEFVMKLSNYEIGKTIGEGAYGKVKYGMHIPSGEKVAIKIINKKRLKEQEDMKKEYYDEADDIMLRKARKKIYNDALKHVRMGPGFTDEQNELNLALFIAKVKEESQKINVIEREPSVSESLSSFQNEVLLMMRFDHPNIIKTFKVVESKEKLYIIMAHAYNGDLASHIAKHGFLTETESRRLFRQITCAVDFIHSSKVVHRDLKMENILLDQQKNALITDFGLGRSFQSNDLMRTNCGTLSYSAPEMISGRPYAAIKTDIWSMGVILYAMVTGKLPFESDTVKTVYKKIANAEYNVPSTISWELQALIKMLLIKDPEKRYDLDMIREDRWINMGYIVPPEHYEPPLMTKESLAKLISSVTSEHDTTIYNINNHKPLAVTKDKVDPDKISSLSGYKGNIKQSKCISTLEYVKIPLEFNAPLATVLSSSIRNESISSSITKGRESNCERNPPQYTNRDWVVQNPQVCNHFQTDINKHRHRSSTCSKMSKLNYYHSKEKKITPEHSRELSILHRMTNDSEGSFPNDVEMNFQEISDWHWIHKPPTRIRTMKFQFRKGLLTCLDPPVVFQELHKALIELKEQFKLKITKLDNYYLFHVEVGKTIGEGAFGKVKLGKHLPSGEKVAVKFINLQKLNEIEASRKVTQEVVDQVMVRRARKKIYDDAVELIKSDPDFAGEENETNLAALLAKVKEEAENIGFEKECSTCESISNFQKEILLMMRFNHPNIIKVFTVIESPEYVCIVMAFAYNGDLASHIYKYGYLTETESRKLFRQIVSAVDFLHSSKVVHRDLKLENILLNQHGNVLVSDFGLGKSFQKSDYMKTFCGTPNYTAPEVAAGMPYHGKQIDIWAMGIILYAMNAGRLPFEGDSLKELFHKIRKTDFEVPGHFTWELLDLLRMVLVEPEKRLDMEKIRHSRWANIGYSEKPEQMEPSPLNKEHLAKMISGVTTENNYMIYTLNAHRDLAMVKTVELFAEKQKTKSFSATVCDLKQRKSILTLASETSSVNQSTIGGKSLCDLGHIDKNTKKVASMKDGIDNDVFSKTNHPRRASDAMLSFLSAKKTYTNESSLQSKTSFAREVSVVNRMNNVSESMIPSEIDVKIQEIQDWHLIHKPPKMIRTMKFHFRKGLVSSLVPAVMFQDLHRALVEMKQQIDFTMTKVHDYYLFHIELNGIMLKIELCKIWLLKMHGLKISKCQTSDFFIQTLIAKLDW
ncbi:ER degradation-enhancing alpha-mannosidase-like protein 2 [Boothiomyces sp. JEL0838]|nr:ER degradation-enhancing alpha-mannosidase-like protein 2 [Boothiomyces sp. JEL0838]